MILAVIYFNETEWRNPFVKLFEWDGRYATKYYGLVTGRVTDIHWLPASGWQITIDAVGVLFVDVIRRAEGDIE